MKKLSQTYLILIIVLGSITITTVLADTVTITTYPYTIQDGSSNQRLVIDSNGNVGIGTTTPSTLLNIAGNSVAYKGLLDLHDSSTTGTSANSFISMYGSDEGSGLTNRIGVVGMSAGNMYVLNSLPSGNVYLGTAGATKATLDSNGNVGIGTTPAQKLDVAGNIRLTGNIVSPNDICIGTC